MSKAERLIEMMITINAKRNFTLSELADEFSVSKRTILRDLQALESIGIPLYSKVGAAGGYHVLRERVLPPITFSENEAKAIFFACQSLKFYRDLPFEQETVSTLKKFLNCLPTDVQHSITQIQNKVVFWTPDRYCAAPLLKDIFDAVMSGQAITIQYSSRLSNSIRTIVPIGLYAMNGLWYCPAYCLKSKAIREFRADRVMQILSCDNFPDDKLKLPDTILDYLDRIEWEADCHIKISLTDIGVKRCETDFLLARGLQRLETGGFIDMYISHGTLDWVADGLLSLGNNATVIEPLELKELVGAKVSDLYDHYCG